MGDQLRARQGVSRQRGRGVELDRLGHADSERQQPVRVDDGRHRERSILNRATAACRRRSPRPRRPPRSPSARARDWPRHDRGQRHRLRRCNHDGGQAVGSAVVGCCARPTSADFPRRRARGADGPRSISAVDRVPAQGALQAGFKTQTRLPAAGQLNSGAATERVATTVSPRSERGRARIVSDERRKRATFIAGQRDADDVRIRFRPHAVRKRDAHPQTREAGRFPSPKRFGWIEYEAARRAPHAVGDSQNDLAPSRRTAAVRARLGPLPSRSDIGSRRTLFPPDR